MAKYKSSSHYSVRKGDKIIKFNYFGEYETEDKQEIEILDALVPRYVKRIDVPKPEPAKNLKTEEPEKPKKGRNSSDK